MKKLLLISTAIVGAAFVSAPASAAVKLDLGGFFSGYGIHADNNVVSERKTEFRRNTEVHVGGETTLDNGLTVGAHTEFLTSNASGAYVTAQPGVTTDEVYAYASGGWGRVNLGVEDGAAYLLQVGAPSADSNIDGLRTYISGISGKTVYSATANGTDILGNFGSLAETKTGYDQADASKTDRITYLTPKYSGFQAGVSYAPKSGYAENMGAPSTTTGTLGFHDQSAATNTAASFDNFYEVAGRWDGEYQGFGLSAGAGYSHASAEAAAPAANTGVLTDDGDWAINDDAKGYNAGLGVTFSGFSLGGSFSRAETSRIVMVTTAVAGNSDITKDTWVVGAGFDNGPYHIGASYLTSELKMDGAVNGANDITGSKFSTDQYTVGGGYTFGPGMTFRGSVAWGTNKAKGNDATATGAADSLYTAADNNDFTQIAVGTDIQF